MSSGLGVGFFSATVFCLKSLFHLLWKAAVAFWKLKPSAMQELKYRGLCFVENQNNQLTEAAS